MSIINCIWSYGISQATGNIQSFSKLETDSQTLVKSLVIIVNRKMHRIPYRLLFQIARFISYHMPLFRPGFTQDILGYIHRVVTDTLQIA